MYAESADSYIFKEFEKYQQNRDEDGPTTPKFPVVQEPVQLRKSHSLKPNRGNSRSNTIHVVQTPSSESNTQQDIQISAPLKLIWRGGKTETIDRGAVVYKNGLLQIQNDTIKSKVEMKMNSTTIKNNKICEFSSAEQSLRVSVEREHQITMGSPRQRRKSVEEDSPKNFNKQNILMKLLRRRSDKQLLERKGIFKCEDIFGNKLTVLHESSQITIPEFVRKAVELIETEKNIKSEHIYRLSGNMATIQKIRLKIDGKNYKVLDDYKSDVDVLTGCLKLFYRELVEPLIPYKTFEELHKLTAKPPSLDRDKMVKSTVKKMQTPHKENLLYLIQHLLTVESYKQFNKMTLQNLSIVWGPSMLWYPGAEKCTAYSPYEFSMLVNGVLELILTTYQTDPEITHQIQVKNDSREDEFKDIDTLTEDTYRKSPSASSSSSKWLFGGLRKAESKDKLTASSWSLSETKKDKQASFGSSLESLEKCENSNIPKIILLLVEAIEKHPNIKGLYCKPGSKDPIGKFKKKIQKNKPDISKMDPLDVAIVLLKFLQELERPLLHGTIYEDFKEHCEECDDGEILALLREDIANLSREHQETIERLVNHVLFIFDRQETESSKENIYNAWLPIFSNSTEINSYNSKFMKTILDIYDTRRLSASYLPLKKDFKFRTLLNTNSMDESYTSDSDRMGIYSRNSSGNIDDNLSDGTHRTSINNDESRNIDENVNTNNVRRISNKSENKKDPDNATIDNTKHLNADTYELASKLKNLMEDGKKDVEVSKKDLDTIKDSTERKNSVEKIQKDIDLSEIARRHISRDNTKKENSGLKNADKWSKVRESFVKAQNKDMTANTSNTKKNPDDLAKFINKPPMRMRTQSPANTKRTFKDTAERQIIGLKRTPSPFGGRNLINKSESILKDSRTPTTNIKSNSPSPISRRKYGDRDDERSEAVEIHSSPRPVRKVVDKTNLSTKNDNPPVKPKIVISSPIISRRNKPDISSKDDNIDDTKKVDNKANLFAKNFNTGGDNKRIELSKVHVNALNKIIGEQSLERLKARTETTYKKT